jgi:aryl-alcohol dehydrogenase-like predicted oxidoreductase
MTKRHLGHTDLEVPPIMLGGNVFGWTVSEADSFNLLDRAFDAGLNFIDTADVYSRWAPGHTGGESETIIGKWFARSGKRDQVIIATKVGMDMGDGKIGLSPKHIRESVEGSLKRLQTDRIDLYQSHKDDENTPMAATLSAFDQLIKEGKVRYIGASNFTGARLREAMETSAIEGLAAYQSLQPHYNLVERAGYESDLAPVVAEFGLGAIPYFALAAGFLSGKYKSAADAEGKARGKAVAKYLNDRGFAVVAEVEAIARETNSTPTAVALAWLIAQPGITAPIASASSEQQLPDLVAATRLALNHDALDHLAKISA